MNTNYYVGNTINPNFGFNKLSIGNPFNYYGYENSKTISSKPGYSTNTHKFPTIKMYDNFILEENKVGLKTNPKQPPMTNTYNLNTQNVKTEQKYNPYFAANNYPQWMDKVKDLMNYTYNEEKAPIYYNTNQVNDDFNKNYGIYGQNNITKEINKSNIITNAPLSSRVPKVDNNIYSNLVNKNYHYIGNNKNYLNQNDNFNNINYSNNTNTLNNNQIVSNELGYTTNNDNYYTVQNNLINKQNQIGNQTNNLQNNNGENYFQNLTRNTLTNNQIFQTNEIVSDNNATEYYRESKGGLVKSYAYIEEANKTHREYMEDQAIAVENFNNDPNKILFGLFDGHGGGKVSKFLQENFVTYMKQMFPNTNYFQGFDDLFKQLDDKVRELNCPEEGSTATIVYIERQNNKKYLYCVNVGDSRCIIINKKGIMRLSRDDRVEEPKEKERIINQGGVIYNGRIYGTLMLSRSFGDWSIKNYGVSCEPHIAKIEINEDDLFLIIASDGVWDFMKEDDFQILMKSNLNPNDICKDVINESLRKGSSDNISCFVIKL